ncbi:acyl-CoA dehydrogenase family protein [Mycobacterium vicinigordonae]|uniref:Acyl-CoA dehydrogenase/oxidase C-terminal domain-containing protein n=1 Tax=Mycobacterium vicinigordonae TaxID=1719132 RepID=A0A7D6E1E3_9MYCO|nr:acyl-CoA dehydrogenase family protein [Mycobacterium vicinigordonae]QLL08729.1 hypothetical protein H0P51_07390 [Mycobacterium vicinigordonae]
MMDLGLSPSQLDLIAATRRAATTLFPVDTTMEAITAGKPSDIDGESWRRAAELGWFSISLGAGLSLVDAALVSIELGRALVPGPLIGTLLAAELSRAAGHLDLALLFESGRARSGIMVDLYAVGVAGEDYAIGVRDDGADLYELTAVEPVHGIDEATPIARVRRRRTVASVTDGRFHARLLVLLASYLVGLAERATEMSTAYASVREQFGKPIGSFQAVKHRCAEMTIRAHTARAQVLMAALLVESDGTEGGALESASGYLLAMQAAERNADDNVQNHGGVGVVAECPAGAVVKRAQTYVRLGPDRRSLSSMLLDARPTQIV